MQIRNEQTDVTTYFVLRDDNGDPVTDVTITDIDLYYVKDGLAMSTKVDATALDSVNSSHADNKAIHVGQGVYRIDWPDAVFNGGVGTKVQLIVVDGGGSANEAVMEAELSSFDTTRGEPTSIFGF